MVPHRFSNCGEWDRVRAWSLNDKTPVAYRSSDIHSMLAQILLPIAATAVVYLLLHALQILYRNLASPLRHILRSPRIPNFITGNFMEMAADPKLTSEWRKEFGHNFIFHGLFSVSELHTSDLKALNHIVTHSDIYVRGDVDRDIFRRLMGEGIIFAEGDQHKRHRRVMNPAFSVPQIRAVTEIFVDKSVQLRDVWGSQIAQQGGGGTVEVLSGLRKMTLDVIGRAGFDYEFNALEEKQDKPNELNRAFTDIFHSPQANLYATVHLAQSMMPILKLLPLPGGNLLHSARTRMDTVGKQIINKSKASLKEQDVAKTIGGQRDLLSILLKANMSPGLPESQKLSDGEVIAQIPGFFLAGHETTSSATAWAMHALSLNKSAQTKLREELFSVDTENPTLDELNALPYLDQVIRETLRVHAPVLFIRRTAIVDDVLPLSKPVIDKKGREHWSLPIPKGQTIHLPLWAVNTSTETWGEDALEFKPERWDNTPEAATAVPGVWGNLFTFFAGPHNCIGFRFSLVEMKALLFTLIRAFEIDPAVSKGGIGPLSPGLIQNPAVLGEQQSGLPLILQHVKKD
ncbi:cytochrome P450 [Mycena amicta]|nr:cytochrome P450 [Mycena amicta]